jgi:alpha-beta hydrolase superfamily lysophospholipase
MSMENSSVSSDQSATFSGTIARPQWLDEQLYPFQSRFVEVEGNRIHYIDEGTGPTLFFVHPGVGWSLTYSDIIKDLRSRFRCVALDLPGFGLSPAAPALWTKMSAEGHFAALERPKELVEEIRAFFRPLRD